VVAAADQVDVSPFVADDAAGPPSEQGSAAVGLALDSQAVPSGQPLPGGSAPEGLSAGQREIIRLAASAERVSEHPLASAVVGYAKSLGLELPGVEEFNSLTGKGVCATVEGLSTAVGNAALMAELGVATGGIGQVVESLQDQGKTAVYVAADGQLLGVIGIADVVKPTSADAVAQLRRLGLKVIMVTGDTAATAAAIGAQVGVDDVFAEVLPGGKEQHIAALQAAGQKVAMVGDGINDAPALARADVGVAIGSGTDVAIEAADIVLVRSNLTDVPTAIQLSGRTIRTIKQNLFWAFGYNVIGIPIAAGLLYIFGGPLLSPLLAAAAMSLSSVSVLTNALRLKRFHPTR
jgi:Cu+-exporting ATPase